MILYDKHGSTAAEWPAGGGTPTTVLDEPAMKQTIVTGQKMTGTADRIDTTHETKPSPTPFGTVTDRLRPQRTGAEVA